MTRDGVLLTDLYQLTMLQAYFDHDMDGKAVFEFFVRKLPPARNFLMAAGLEQVLDFLENLRFTPEDLDWVAGHGSFSKAFVDYLAGLRFTGDVHAMPEGTVFFPDEPILRVTAPLPEAQLVESRVLNLLHLETLIASKASRCVLAGRGKLLVDFGFRRAHGSEAGVLAARASYLAGYGGTATVLAGALYRIPVFGTMAHSFIEAHDGEAIAFEHFARSLPGGVTLLIDTYDTEAAARKLVDLAARLAQDGITIQAVRIDSGDLGRHARAVRSILDAGNLSTVQIFASGNLDEYSVKQLVDSGTPIDGFGIGTRVDTSADAPYLDAAYKLQEYAGAPRRKWSEGKVTWPGPKQVYRQITGAGEMARDVLTVDGDRQPGDPLLRAVVQNGKRLAPAEPLSTIRERASRELARLPVRLRRLDQAAEYPVLLSGALRELARTTDESVRRLMSSSGRAAGS